MNYLRSVAAGGLLGVASLLGVVLTTGCGSPSDGAQATGDKSVQAAVASTGSSTNLATREIIRVGQKVTIDIQDTPPPGFLSKDYQVREDGTITGLPLNITIKAAGRQPADIEKELTDQYLKTFRRVSVSVKVEQRVFYVGGSVRRPDRYFYLGEKMTVLNAIKVAGDFTEFAKKTAVEVTRSDGTKLPPVDCKKAQRDPAKYDVPIYPGDNIYVPPKWL